MKTCPICRSTLFDDMGVCYGCMYEFGTKPELEKEAGPSDSIDLAVASASASALAESVFAEGEKVASAPSATLGTSRGAAIQEGEASFSLPMLTVPATDGRPVPAMPWTVRFEVRSADDPATTWAMELVPSGSMGSAKSLAAESSRH